MKASEQCVEDNFRNLCRPVCCPYKGTDEK